MALFNKTGERKRYVIATFWKSNNSNNSLLKKFGKTIPYFLSHSYQSLIIEMSTSIRVLD